MCVVEAPCEGGGEEEEMVPINLHAEFFSLPPPFKNDQLGVLGGSVG